MSSRFNQSLHRLFDLERSLSHRLMQIRAKGVPLALI